MKPIKWNGESYQVVRTGPIALSVIQDVQANEIAKKQGRKQIFDCWEFGIKCEKLQAAIRENQYQERNYQAA